MLKMFIMAATGIGSAVMQSTAKYEWTGYSMEQRFWDFVANVIGNSMTKKINPNYVGAADFSLNPWGWANKYTGTGIALLFGTGILRKMKIPYTSRITPYTAAAGEGFTVGGVFGGIFDPPNGGGNPTSRPTNRQYSNATSGNPFKR